LHGTAPDGISELKSLHRRLDCSGPEDRMLRRAKAAVGVSQLAAEGTWASGLAPTVLSVDHGATTG